MLGSRAAWGEGKGGIWSLVPAQSSAQPDSPENTSPVSDSQPPGCCGSCSSQRDGGTLWDGIRLYTGVLK